MTSGDGVLSAPVSRALARDDLLMMARDAEVAVGIVRSRDNIAIARTVQNEGELFTVALDVPPPEGRRSVERMVESEPGTHPRRGDHPILSAIVGIEFEPAEDPVRLYERAVRALHHPSDGEPLPRDLTLEVMTTYRRIRDLRLCRDYKAALALADQRDDRFCGTGAEPYRADFQYELGACLLRLGQAKQVAAALGESEKAYWEATRAGEFVTRHRYDFIRGLAAWETGAADRAADRFTAARTHLERTGGEDPHYDVRRLSLTLASAELLASGERNGSAVHEAVQLTRLALTTAERIRSRWSVIARSRSPLSVAFRRIYGDIALLVSELPGREAAELGLRIALSAKQTASPAALRTGRSLISDHVHNLIEDIVDAGEPHRTVGGRQQGRHDEGRRPRHAQEGTPRRRVTDARRHGITRTGRRRASGRSNRHEVRTGLCQPAGHVDRRTQLVPYVHRADRGDRVRTLRTGRTTSRRSSRAATAGRAGSGNLRRAVAGRGPDWRGLALEVLPGNLFGPAAGPTRDEPLELVLSAHSSLSLLPWAALTIDDTGTRLVERAVIAQTPVLTCLSDTDVPPVAGPALVRLVSDAGSAVSVDDERTAWGLELRDGQVPLTSCGFAQGSAPVELTGTLASALRGAPNRWGFVHIASHGGGDGLDQHLRLPEQLSAGQALALPWPESVLMASCHVGRLFNIEDAEPLSFVMALLTGGSRCVVAAMDSISDSEAGELAAKLVADVRDRRIRLDVALRQAQLEWVRRPVILWALFSAYVR